MRRIGFGIVLAWVVAAAASPALADFTKAWDNLTANPNPNWIGTSSVNMYAANSSNVYSVGFQTAKSGMASGMSALKFVDSSDSHHVSNSQAASVDVLTTGSTVYGDVLVLVAIDATSLPENFALTMNNYACTPATDFVYYDGAEHPLGRLTGYYPGTTNPTSELIAYNFSSAMVTVLAFTPETPLDSTHPFTLEYDFENLPDRAVFSVYGLPTGGTTIYHTNRGLDDLNNPTKSTISTFEVLPEPASLALLACGFVTLLRPRRC